MRNSLDLCVVRNGHDKESKHKGIAESGRAKKDPMRLRVLGVQELLF